MVGAGVLRFFLLVARGDGEHFLALAQSVRQHDRAADHLIGVLRIDAETGRQLHGLIELRVFDLLEQGNRVLNRQRMRRNLLLGGFELLAHLLTSCGSNGSGEPSPPTLMCTFEFSVISAQFSVLELKTED